MLSVQFRIPFSARIATLLIELRQLSLFRRSKLWAARSVLDLPSLGISSDKPCCGHINEGAHPLRMGQSVVKG